MKRLCFANIERKWINDKNFLLLPSGDIVLPLRKSCSTLVVRNFVFPQFLPHVIMYK